MDNDINDIFQKNKDVLREVQQMIPAVEAAERDRSRATERDKSAATTNDVTVSLPLPRFLCSLVAASRSLARARERVGGRGGWAARRMVPASRRTDAPPAATIPLSDADWLAARARVPELLAPVQLDVDESPRVRLPRRKRGREARHDGAGEAPLVADCGHLHALLTSLSSKQHAKESREVTTALAAMIGGEQHGARRGEQQPRRGGSNVVLSPTRMGKAVAMDAEVVQALVGAAWFGLGGLLHVQPPPAGAARRPTGDEAQRNINKRARLGD